MIIYADGSRQVKWPKTDSHDPDSEQHYYLDYYPELRVDSTSYTKGIDLIVSSVDNGCMYECTSGGNSAAIEASFPTIEGGEHEDGDVTWLCRPLNTMLGAGDSISSSAWTGEDGVVLTDVGVESGITTVVKVLAIPVGVTKFSITNEVVVSIGGKTEKHQRTLIIPVKEL